MKAKNNNKKIKNSGNSFINHDHKREVGRLGEDLACQFLEAKKYRIIERNYLKKCGEIDIVALKDNMLTFIEVKSIIDDYSSTKIRHSDFRPEENVHIQKRLRLRRTIQVYMAKCGISPESVFSFHILIVRMNMNTRRAHIECLENMIL